jgi:DNA processing protein
MVLDEYYYLYKLLKLKGVGPVLVNKMLLGLSSIDKHISDTLLEESLIDGLKNWLDDDKIEQLKTFDPKLHDQINQLKEQNAHFISKLDDEYPRILLFTLRHSTPPVLSCMGNLRLLEMPSAGFCGSRKASQEGLHVARDCVEQLVREEVAIVSGYAGGVDQQVHITALESGGCTIIVLPEGILNFKIRRTLRDIWDWNRVLVVSEFLPDDIWLSSRAMQRNKTIVGLSRVMVLIEAGKNGGSMDAGKSTLKFKRNLYVPLYENMLESTEGNTRLIKLGATPLLKDKKTGKANLNHLIDNIKHFKCGDNVTTEQLTFL